MTLTAASDTLEMIRGDIVTWQFTVTDNSTAVNLTGATVRFVVRDSIPAGTTTSDSGAVFVVTTTDNISLTDPTNGIMEITVPKASTYSPASVNTLEYFYGVEAIFSGATDPASIAYGKLKIYPDIVRA